MAPKKKKKKNPANPAREFSTVSIPSKLKASEVTHNELCDNGALSTPKTEAAADVPEPSDLPKWPAGTSSHPNIRDVMPDQLDAYLEDAEMETLLDSNSVRCKSDATRQISRLKIEIRQLRAQSMVLASYGWLDESTVDAILSVAMRRKGKGTMTAKNDLLKHGDHKLILDLWVLEQVLSSLGFPRRDDALANVLRLAFTRQLSPDGGYIWGLIESFDWYALNLPLEELPHYQTSTPLSMQDSQRWPTLSSTPTNGTDSLRAQKEAVFPHAVSIFDGGMPHDEEIAGFSDESSQDDENDPLYLRDKYVRLKAQLWERERAAMDSETSSPRQKQKMERQRSKIANIERDILFDKDEADRVWRPIEIRLEAEESVRKRAEKKAQAKSARSSGSRRENRVNGVSTEPSCDVPKSIDGDEDEDEDADVFGSIFASVEDQEDKDPRPLASNIRIEDFGSSTGLTTRQLLEQSCQAIDSDYGLKFGVLEQTTYSCRHRIDLVWTGQHPADAYAIQAVSPEIKLDLEPQHWTLEMQKIAATNAEQSASYAAAVMLFLVSSLEGQTAQTSLRLAGSWRELLVSLFNTRKEVIKSHDKMELKNLRRLIDTERENYDGLLKNEASSSTGKESSSLSLPVHQRRIDIPTFTPERARREWESRSKSPAFRTMLQIREKLPIYRHKARILQTIDSNPISIISAETGSGKRSYSWSTSVTNLVDRLLLGKSTQCGSFILEQELSCGRDCRVLITQPRRISAISLARRVSQELGEAPGALGTVRSLIGYSIRLESRTSLTTRLTFVTTGVLLRMLESSPMLEQLDCLILDEVHERTLETDLLFIALRELVKKRTNLKVLLMSATVDAQMFSEYFGGAPVLNISGRTFPVDVRFLEDAIEATNNLSDENFAQPLEPEESEADGDHQRAKELSAKPYDLTGYSARTMKRLTSMHEHRIDYGLIVKLAVVIATNETYAMYSSAVLIFMPGIAEIRRLHHALLSTDTFRSGWRLHMLHSSFSTEELERALLPSHMEEKKIVIATNIAETGITIPDVTAVIDTCKEKIMRYDERRQLSKLTESFISRSSAKQRRGRAARVQDGLCFHLVTKYHHDNLLQEQSTPEILRLGLQDAILRIKIWNFGSTEETLGAAITPPSKKNIVRAVEKLREVGALSRSESLTPLGEQMARLPLDVTLSKLAIFGAIFQCLDPVLAIISIMTSKSPFINEMAAKTYFSRGDSDLISVLGAYKSWKKARSIGSAIEFCRKNRLSDHMLMQIEEQKIHLFVYLVDGGQVILSRDEKMELNRARIMHTLQKDFYEIPQRYNKTVGDDLLLCLISMAFYPRILVREGKGWRNIYTNQQVSLAKRSVNDGGSKWVKWLSFSEAMRAGPGNLNVYETSRIPEAALVFLLGHAEMKLFSGVLSIDSGRTRLAVGNWKQAVAIKEMRGRLLAVLDRCYQRPGEPLPVTDQWWLRLLLDMTATKEAEIV